MNRIKWYHVHVDGACWGFQTIDGIVSQAAKTSLGKKIIGMEIEEVKKAIRRRKGEIFNEYWEKEQEPEERQSKPRPVRTRKAKSGRVRRK